MDRIKAVLLEIDQKAASSSDAYELIMTLLKGASPKLQDPSNNGRFLPSGVTGSPGDRE
jgi:hypothetical protein